jgi:hypothetical protein
MIEAFWSRMQVELLDRRRWKTRIELANAIFEYLEIWHNRRRRHSALGWQSPLESRPPRTRSSWPEASSNPLRGTRGTPKASTRAVALYHERLRPLPPCAWGVARCGSRSRRGRSA